MAERPTFAWFDDLLPSRRATRVRTFHELLLFERLPDTDVPIPAEPTLCAEKPDDWFPEKGQPVGWVKALCRSCWMLQECRKYGLDHPDEDGVWGGLTPAERRSYVTKRRKA